MEEVASTARLVDAEAVSADSALTATLPRANIEAALEDDAGADLFLEIARIQDGERNDRTLKVAWERADLEKMLESASGDQVTLKFDQEELERMLEEADVEGHGLRQTALVLSVAIATAAGMAGSAAAYVASDGGPAAASGAISGLVTDNTSAAVAGTTAPEGISGLVTDASTSGQQGAVSGLMTDTSTSGEPGAVSGLITDTGAEATRTPAAPAAAGGGSGFSVPNAAVDAALAAGIALMLTGAAFVGRSRRRAQPA